MIVERIWTGNAYRNFNYLIACPETGEALAIRGHQPGRTGPQDDRVEIEGGGRRHRGRSSRVRW